jgi:hypothetical protein
VTRYAWRSAALFGVCLSLSACISGGFDAAEEDSVDQAAQTGSLAASGQPVDPTRVSDETIIRNAVSAADPEAAQVQPLAWANAETGSRGAISNMIEKKEAGTLCREFTASRESFDGVALYSGDACKGDRGVWYMRNFKPL